MKLLPFFVTQKKTEFFLIWKLSVFLNHAGKSVWESDSPGLLSIQQIRSEYCDPNGFVLENLWINKESQVAYLSINADKTSLSDFYTWEEALARVDKPECWRSFYFIQDQDSLIWWSPKDLIEGEIQGLGNIQDSFEEILRSKDSFTIKSI
jgi:hypothetical protein